MLGLQRVTVDIQGSRILSEVTLDVGQRELVCLVGRNGAGKTTTLRTIMGYLRPAAGAITFKDESLVGRPTHAIAALGVGFAPEESEVFGDLTVAENIEIATWTRPTARSAAERVERAYAVFPRLRQYAERGGTQLSGGERKMLSLARALALDPELLLLDEPFEGLAPAIVPVIVDAIADMARLGHSILLSESNIHHVPEQTTRLYVIERGEIIFRGTRDEARRERAVLDIIGGAF
ncbi:MAG TPA: ATP-binding cassette domain-containing protein [Methylomirabilota bacterium]|jgi:branched-chain amino acid transport system ATP-binding protein